MPAPEHARLLFEESYQLAQSSLPDRCREETADAVLVSFRNDHGLAAE
jgi:hypothetical protein